MADDNIPSVGEALARLKQQAHPSLHLAIMDLQRALGATPQAAQPPSFPTGTRYTVERHGDGWAIYRGRDREHHGLNLGHLTECSAELAAMIADALNAQPQAAQVPEAIARLRDGLWVFSSNDDVFRSEEFDSEQDAIAGALSYGYDEEDRIYVGQVKLLNVRRMIGKRVESMLDWVGEDAGEEVGESADGWPSLPRERIDELQQMVADFILTHSPAPFYMVENVRSYSNAEAEAALAAAQAQGVGHD